jgi:hypothetical protein
MLRHFIGFIVVCLCAGATGWSQAPRVRLSAWYWLNSAPKVDWQGDFTTMKNLGFTDVLLGWGLDAAAIVTRPEETKQAIAWAHKAGLGAYLIVWHPYGNSLERKPEFMQVDSNGRRLETFDVFNAQWRSTQWKEYLQKVARIYRNQPGYAGYVFDDSFGAGGTGVVSYGAYEQHAFGGPLPKKPGDPRWDDWVKMREGWWEDWARDTVHYIRVIDPDQHHEIYLEDLASSIIDKNRPNNIGLEFTRVARHFDAVGGYIMASWNDSPDSGRKVAQEGVDVLTKVREMVGPKKQIIYTFWSANPSEEHNNGPAKYPTAEQIQMVSDAALKLGIRHLDMYGYRIGDPDIPKAEWPKWVPAEPAPYLLTGQFPQKFLWDRPEVHEKLANYLLGLNSK